MKEYMFQFPEVSLSEEHVIATYYLESGTSDPIKYALALADEQTTGTWVEVPGETDLVKKEFGGKVLNVFEVPDYEFELPKGTELRRYILQIGFPSHNFGPEIPMMFSAVIGNLVSTGNIKLLDLTFPKSLVEGYKGPKFGIEGLRKLMNIPERPFLNNMIKPCTGWLPDDGAKMSYEVAKGGVDVIKDDELIKANPPWCPLEERVKKIMAAIKRAKEETGEDTLYTVNITDKINKLKDNALRAIEAGANALMINTYTIGLAASHMICEDPDINVPILAHLDFAGATFASPEHGISSPLLVGKLARMIGADMAIIATPYGKFPVLHNKYRQQVNYCRQAFWHIKPMLPLCSGGATALIAPQTIEELGYDIALAAGGAIHGHPMGSEAGAKSMRQAIDATMKGIPLEEYAKDHVELAEAIKKWGRGTLFDLQK